jgi:hypothetical protein
MVFTVRSSSLRPAPCHSGWSASIRFTTLVGAAPPIAEPERGRWSSNAFAKSISLVVRWLSSCEAIAGLSITGKPAIGFSRTATFTVESTCSSGRDAFEPAATRNRAREACSMFARVLANSQSRPMITLEMRRMRRICQCLEPFFTNSGN